MSKVKNEPKYKNGLLQAIRAQLEHRAFWLYLLCDEAGKRVVDKYIEYIAVGISNIINTFQPEILCIGGGISKEGNTLIDPINYYVKGDDYARSIKRRTVIKTATLGNDAGVIGAAYLCNIQK